jgi:hypothetical protein
MLHTLLLPALLATVQTCSRISYRTTAQIASSCFLQLVTSVAVLLLAAVQFATTVNMDLSLLLGSIFCTWVMQMLLPV